jgi:hypothetical protein
MELFSLETSMAAANRFIFPTNTLGVAQQMRYALHMGPRPGGAPSARHRRTRGCDPARRKVVSVTRREDGFPRRAGNSKTAGGLRADLSSTARGLVPS